ncbi:MAG TPA: peptide chain release factor 1 [Spirochaetia bacterium]|nr:peptide chain release factor 1 [Spirochaetia bacterium]
MFNKLKDIETRYEELGALMAEPEVMADRVQWQQYVKQHADLTDLVAAFREYNKTAKDLASARELMADNSEPELQEMAEQEAGELIDRLAGLEDRLKVMLLPHDPNDEKNVIVEIRAGTGGEEAALFAADLFRMYSRYAERQGWRSEILNTNFTDIGGVKEVIVTIEGKGAYSRLKFESGVHRVQRVPATESSGRIHTSAATVAVLAEAEDVEVEINPADLRIDVFCSTGPGGQSVNTTQSAVRITHLPTGIVVSCQDEKSQHKNKDKGMRVMRARLKARAEEEQRASVESTRRSLVGSGDRSERIRTYNFPQNRITDHRIALTTHRLEEVLQGALDDILDALVTSDQAERLRSE